MNAIINVQDFVQVKNSQTITTSEFIAQAFNKRHDNVLQSIDNLLADIDPAFAAQNFRETEISTQNNLGFTVKNRAYELTKDGFMLLVMGFTGKAALAIKIAYIQAFNKMAEMLSGSLKTKTALPNGLTLEQQDVVKAMHREILEQTPPEMRKALAIKLWASIKQKFGCTYKAVSPDCFNEVISLMGRIAVENGVETLHGEVLDKQPENAEITFSQSELRELATVTYYCAWACDLLRELAAPLSALGYERASTVRTLPMESHSFLRRTHKALLREMPKISSAFERECMQNSLSRCEFLI
jgi:phage regulatory protein, rha family|nr:MAG TPA: regulatory protein [Caudoviricetes sp.]DAT92708.1 MAG TPA: regulatory protein [Caudoviricetes sp.]